MCAPGGAGEPCLSQKGLMGCSKATHLSTYLGSWALRFKGEKPCAVEKQADKAQTPSRSLLEDLLEDASTHRRLSQGSNWVGGRGVGWASRDASRMGSALFLLGPTFRCLAAVTALCWYGVLIRIPENRTHSLEWGNFWMWIKVLLTLPPDPAREIGDP